MPPQGEHPGNASCPITPPNTVPIPAWVLDESCWGEGQAQGQYYGHYSADRDVILRLEVISSNQCKVLTLLSFLFTLVAAGALAGEATIKFVRDPRKVLLNEHDKYFTAGLTTGCVLLALLLFVLVHFAWRLGEALRSGRQWSHRRRRVSLLAFSQLVVQTLNTILWVVLSSYVMSADCSWQDLIVVMLGWSQWTLWNTELLLIIIAAHSGNLWRGGKFSNAPPGLGRPSGSQAVTKPGSLLVLDAPWTIHAPKLIPWVLMELVVCLMARNIAHILRATVAEGSCNEVEITCTVGMKTTVYIALMVACVGMYLIIYAVHIFATFRQLKMRPYMQSKLSYMLYSIQLRQVFIVFATLALAVVLLLLVKLDSCWSFIFSWFGMLPMHVAASSMCIITSWYFMPKNPSHHNQILKVWLQEFAWTASSLPRCLGARNRHLASSAKLAAQPMFCFETALRMLYWSSLVYDYEEVPDSPLDLEFAMGLYGLEGVELLWDRSIDMKALVGWSGDGRIVIAFRGTASLENVKTDLKLWQVVHPPERRRPVSSVWGLRRMVRTLKVHSGFWQAWGGLPPTTKLTQQQQSTALQRQQGQQREGWQQESATGRAQGQQQESATGRAQGQQRWLAGQRPPQPAVPLAAHAAEVQLSGREDEGALTAQRGALLPGGQQLAKPATAHGDPLKLGDAEMGAAEQQLGGEGGQDVPYNQQLLALVAAIVEEQGLDPSKLVLYLTGHSLGGAMASLAARDLKQHYPSSTLCVYTYGQPRVGNRPFAAEYNSLVPDHFSIICDQDPVPRVPKSTYKRCGSRVIVNAQGDMIIRPTFLESSILRRTGVVTDHLLERYRAAFASVVKAQFTSKRLPGGEQGVVELSEQVDLDQVLLCQGLDLASLRDEASHPITLEELERRQQTRDIGLLSVRLSFVRRKAASLCGGCAAQLPGSQGSPEGVGTGSGSGGRAAEEVEEWVEQAFPPDLQPAAGGAGAIVEVTPERQGRSWQQSWRVWER